MSAQPLRIFIVDDEAPARARLREVLDDVLPALPNVVVGEAANGHEALARLPMIEVDVVLIDIHMPQMSGMELARHLQLMESKPAIVFVTAHDEHALEAFEVNALDYLLKPVRASRLLVALQKARAATREQIEEAAAKAGEGPRKFLSVSERGRILLVPTADVIYLRAELKYVTVRTLEREHLIEESLTSLEQEFGAAFVRIHRSCLVARRCIRGFERIAEEGEGAGWAVLLEGCDDKLPVSRRQWAAVKAIANGQ